MKKITLIFAICLLCYGCDNSVYKFKGLSFINSENYIIQTEVLENNFAFAVVIAREDIGIGNLMLIHWLRTTKYSPIDMLANVIGRFDNIENKVTSSYYNDNFGNIGCISIDFIENNYFIENNCTKNKVCYGKLQSFVINGNVVLIKKKNFIKDNLDTDFQYIENSLNIK